MITKLIKHTYISIVATIFSTLFNINTEFKYNFKDVLDTNTCFFNNYNNKIIHVNVFDFNILIQDV